MYKKMLVLVACLGLLTLTGCDFPRSTTTPETDTTTQEISIQNWDQVEISYILSFANGAIYQEGETTIQAGSAQGRTNKIALLNAKIGDTFYGEVTPEDMNTRDEYDASKRQSLAEIFFTELEITPAIGAMVNIPGIGTGEISKTEESEGNTYYIVDFNAPETYQNLNYMVQVIAINKA